MPVSTLTQPISLWQKIAGILLIAQLWAGYYALFANQVNLYTLRSYFPILPILAFALYLLGWTLLAFNPTSTRAGSLWFAIPIGIPLVYGGYMELETLVGLVVFVKISVLFVQWVRTRHQASA